MGTSAAILAWREKPKPGSRPLTLLLTGQIWWSIFIVLRLQTVAVEDKLFLASVIWVGIVFIPLGWVLFAIEYTGRHRFLERKYIVGLSVIPVLTVIIVTTSPFHDLLTVTAHSFGPNGILQISFSGAWYWVVTIYTYTLGLIGIVLLLELILSNAFTFRKQALTLTIGLIVPWSTNILYITGFMPKTGIDPTPIAFSISGVAYLLAISKFRLIRENPAPNKRAREVAFDKMQEGAVVVDLDENVVDVNQRALTILQTERNSLLGTPADEIFPDFEQIPQEGTLDEFLSIEQNGEQYHFEFEATMIRATRGKPVGRVITFNDVTNFLHQQQRLEVLNRVLRHNIRTETNLILGFAEGLAGESAKRVKKHALRIEEFGDKGREAIDLFDQARGESEPRNLGTIIQDSISAVGNEHPDLEISYRGIGSTVYVESLIDTVIKNIIENATKHNSNSDPKIWVIASETGEEIEINIADNGPGIDEYELSVLAEGSETDLKHGSGFGLWIIKWGVDLANGAVSFRNRSPFGTVVTLKIPKAETIK